MAVPTAFLLLPPGGEFVSQTDERLRRPEKNQAEIYCTLEGKKEAGLMAYITERITLSGLIQAEHTLDELVLEDGSESAACGGQPDIQYGACVTWGA